MLAWLDKANSGAVKGASDRLSSAAAEIRKVATELRDRPQRVEWKGEGANAFQTWSADLANATLRLGDFSAGVSKWLAEASNAIATAQASIPRTHGDAQANLEAARIARNDPDASVVARKSAETLIATQEANRHEAAAQMRRLAQTYSFSAQKMDGLERPVFPPPPGAIVPERADARDSSEQEYTRGGASGEGGSYAAYSSSANGARQSSSGTHTPLEPASIPSNVSSVVARPVDMEIDGVATLPESPSIPAANPQGAPVVPRGDGTLPPVVGGMPPGVGANRALTPSLGGPKQVGIARPNMPLSGGGQPPGQAVRPPREGITGGRPIAQNTGRPTGGLPRGNVIGNEGTHGGRASMGHGPGMGGGGGGQNGIVGGRRLSGETGGVVGSRPQPQGRAGARPFTPGGTGLVRGSGPSEGTRGSASAGRAAALGSPRSGRPPRDENGERPDYLVEDEETWQQGSRRIVPPVID